ncbi:MULTISPECIES: TonB system transport protein ExbD [Helicobacter]|uniref:Biopolymer transport protein ExbD n=1 Tax=Helicobacter ganmani TaxID=60246 RepID=A0A3D8IB62_9HELI|nr:MULTISPECIES: TonB system transport protein ExbD [Helicobacter]RDU62004.1 TonB system transport protein ExbD [Helicobacter ganmani]
MLKIQHSEGLNIVPFIDVILVLLAMVLSISTFIAHGEIKIELPKSDSSMQSSNDSNKIQILINAQDVYYLEDKETTLEEIQKRINTLDKQTIVELKSDKNATFNSFVQIIDILRTNHHENFQIITEKNQ